MDGRLSRVPPQPAPSLDEAAAVRRLIDHARAEQREIDLGEAWAALHFLIAAEIPMPKPVALERGLSWSADSMENVLMGGRSTAYGASYGPARYLGPREVARLAARLGSLDVEEVFARYDPTALNGESIPPGDWSDDPETRGWLRDRYVALVDFYRTAADHGEAILLYMI